MKHAYLLHDPEAIERGDLLLGTMQEASTQWAELLDRPRDVPDMYEDPVERCLTEAIAKYAITPNIVGIINPYHYELIGRQVIQAKFESDEAARKAISSRKEIDYDAKRLEILEPVMARLLEAEGKPIAVETLLEGRSYHITSYKTFPPRYPKRIEGYINPAQNMYRLEVKSKPTAQKPAYSVQTLDIATRKTCVRMAIGE